MQRRAAAAAVHSQRNGGPLRTGQGRQGRGIHPTITMDYFEVFGLSRALAIDPPALERTFHQLSRQYHPDYFTAAPETERVQAVRMTALINDAYRTLRNPVTRVEYLLGLEGFKADGSKVP